MRTLKNVCATGTRLVTTAIQQAIDQAARQGDGLEIPAGRYLVGSLFLPSHFRLVLAAGATLLGSSELTAYRQIRTRIAGIDLDWPAAILNINQATDVQISGPGMIDGQGASWWQRFWGSDQQSGLMAAYQQKGLRWAADYDCQRPRNLVIAHSDNVDVSNITSIDSGFWNTQIVYSHTVNLKNCTIRNGPGPSTDGIDIDSSQQVTISGCTVIANDDNICLKAGRGRDAAERQTICREVLIENCHLGQGSGITCGSEVSGGIEDVTIRQIDFTATSVGLRLKSARNRGGFIRNLTVSQLKMNDVRYPFLFQTDWYPAYSYCQIPTDYQEAIPTYWRALQTDITGPAGLTKVAQITINDVTAKITPGTISRAFFIVGAAQQPIKNLTFNNVSIQASEFGKISGVTHLFWHNVQLSAGDVTADEHDEFAR